MYLLQIVSNVHFGNTGLADRNIENYEAETLKPLLVKANRRISESSDNVFFYVSFYHIDNMFVTHILEHKFNYERMDIHDRLLYFCCPGQKIEVEDDK